MIAKTLLGTLPLGGLFMILSGLYYQEWWTGFGLVVFMAALIIWVSFQFPPDQYTTGKAEESKITR